MIQKETNTNPLIISGPSGVGKSFLADYLSFHFNCERVVPTTTRQRRLNERDGKDYYFVTIKEYRRIEQQGLFFMSNHFFDNSYGIERESVERITRKNKIPVTEIYTPKVQQFLYAYPQSQAIFLMPESIELIEKRMKQRGQSDEEIRSRLEAALEEIIYFNDYQQNLYKQCYWVNETNLSTIARDIAERFLAPKNTTEGAFIN